MMERRAFIVGLGSAAAWPVVARAQQIVETKRIAYLTPTVARDDPADHAFEEAMYQLGWNPGRNLSVEYGHLGGKQSNVVPLISAVVASEPDAIVVWSPQLALAAKQATNRIPIVFIVVFDPVDFGVVPNLYRPGGNVTGISSLPSVEIFAKRLQILSETVPSRLTRVFVLYSSEQNRGARTRGALLGAARTLHLELDETEVQALPDVKVAFERAKEGGAQAVYVWPSGFTFSFARQISDVALATGMPSVHGFKEGAMAGGLLAYAANLNEQKTRAATYADKILKGAFPGDLPVEQLSKYDLVMNLNTAKALRLTVPPSLLARADEVIE
jgi:putative ABC transport system substrate-binding protein